MSIEDDGAAKAAADRRAAEAAQRTAELAEQQARTAADKAAAELEEWKQNAAARRRTADLDEMTKLQTVVGAATPSLGDVVRGKTETPESPLFASLLAARALTDAAGYVMKAVKPRVPDEYRVFLTTDADIAGRSGRLASLRARLVALTEAVTSFPSPPAPDGVSTSEFSPIVGAATALTKLLPGALSLLSVDRTVRAAEAAPTDARVLTAVAGALAAAEGDDALVLDDSRVVAGSSPLLTQREALAHAVQALEAAIAATTTTPPAELDPAAATAAWAREAGLLVTTSRAFLVSLDAVAAGAAASPLAEALATESMLDGDHTHVLVVRGAGGSVSQLLSDRPLAAKDPIYLAGTAAIEYRLLQRTDWHVVAAGVISGWASLSGTLGSTIHLDGLA